MSNAKVNTQARVKAFKEKLAKAGKNNPAAVQAWMQQIAAAQKAAAKK